MANELTDKELEHSKHLVEKVLRRGMAITSKFTLAELAGLRYERVKLLFDTYPELEVMRKKGLKRMTGQAIENLSKILNDKDHKDHFQATKHVLTKYKTELDEVLEPQDSTIFKVEDGPGRISITFSKNTSEPEEAQSK